MSTYCNCVWGIPRCVQSPAIVIEARPEQTPFQCSLVGEAARLRSPFLSPPKNSAGTFRFHVKTSHQSTRRASKRPIVPLVTLRPPESIMLRGAALATKSSGDATKKCFKRHRRHKEKPLPSRYLDGSTYNQLCTRASKASLFFARFRIHTNIVPLSYYITLRTSFL